MQQLAFLHRHERTGGQSRVGTGVAFTLSARPLTHRRRKPFERTTCSCTSNGPARNKPNSFAGLPVKTSSPDWCKSEGFFSLPSLVDDLILSLDDLMLSPFPLN